MQALHQESLPKIEPISKQFELLMKVNVMESCQEEQLEGSSCIQA